MILIPYHNDCLGLRKTLQSIALATVNNTERVVVVDNASDDDGEVSQECSKLGYDYIRNKTDIGRIQNWNRCLQLFLNSTEQWLRFVFTGDELVKEGFEEQVKLKSQYKFITGPLFYGEELHRACQSGVVTHGEYQKGGPGLQNMFGVAPVLMHRDVIGGFRFDPSLTHVSDFKFFLSILKEVGSVYYGNLPVARFNIEHRKHSKNFDRDFAISEHNELVKSYLENTLQPYVRI